MRPLFFLCIFFLLAFVSLTWAQTCPPASTCTECLQSSGCGWCESTEECLAGDSNGPGGNPANCTDWQPTVCISEDCDKKSPLGCAACTADPFCGWCTGTLSCVFGTAGGPVDGLCSSGYLFGSSACPVSPSPSHSKPAVSHSKVVSVSVSPSSKVIQFPPPPPPPPIPKKPSTKKPAPKKPTVHPAKQHVHNPKKVHHPSHKKVHNPSHHKAHHVSHHHNPKKAHNHHHHKKAHHHHTKTPTPSPFINILPPPPPGISSRVGIPSHLFASISGSSSLLPNTLLICFSVALVAVAHYQMY